MAKSSSNSKKTTSPKAAKAASKVLNDGRTGKASKTAAGSALSQKVGKSKSSQPTKKPGTRTSGPKKS